MILYHGSNTEVKEPKLLTIQRTLDFGSGFYTTSDFEQASRWAKRTALRRRYGKGIVNVYEICDEVMNKLNILRFTKSDVDWLRFVVQNRMGVVTVTDWDIIEGPVANDQSASVIDLYMDDMYDEEEAIKRLLPQKLKDQVVFKTENAIELLCYKEAIKV